MAASTKKLSPSQSTIIVLLAVFVTLTNCLYEDQVGKFDWKQSYVGRLKFAEFDNVKRIVVGTEENVIASLYLKNGQIAWRHVLEEGHTLELLHLGTEIVSVSGDGTTYYVRGFEPNVGTLQFEWTLHLDKSHPVASRWLLHGNQLVHVVPVLNSHLEITRYNYNTGQNSGSTLRVAADWINDLNRCAVAGNYFAYITSSNSESGELLYMDVGGDELNFYRKRLEQLIGNAPGEVTIKPLEKHSESALIFSRNNVNRVVILRDNNASILPYGFNENTLISVQNVLIEFSPGARRIRIVDEGDAEKIVDATEFDLAVNCHAVAGVIKGQAGRILLHGDDDSLSLMQLSSGNISWTREEALSNILTVEFIELPVSELDASIEHEFTTNGDVFGMLFRRVTSQLRQVATFISGGQHQQHQRQLNVNLIRDDFGFHKLILLATGVGKLYAVDSMDGSIIWTRFLPHVRAFERAADKRESYVIYEQRNARYSPLAARCTLLGRDSSTGNGVMYTFDPITGTETEHSALLPFRVKQTMLIPYEDANHLKGILLMSDAGDMHVYPRGALDVLREYHHDPQAATNSLHMYTVREDDKCHFEGFALRYDPVSHSVRATKTWQVRLTTGAPKLVAIATKSPIEKVHSQGRVMADRSVLYKYVNPNLIAVAALSQDALHKSVLSVYLIDGVTGLVVYSANHKRARGPIKLVHSENWCVYTYTNEKFRRVEVAAVELYEGTTQSNGTTFSSYALSQLPHFQTQAYILPVNPVAMTATLTERGVTNKHLLVALSSGFVAEVPWALLEPRGGANNMLQASAEEGGMIMPYMPEVGVPAEAYVNYNRSLERVRDVRVSPARLESTSLVLVYGLDVFYTRVAPSKTFDVLKEDFDHWLIVTVLSGLLLASYATKKFASRKALRQAWK